MISNFQPSLAFVLRHECVFAPGHVNDLNFVICEDVPGDAGGCTKFGIDAASHPGVDIPNLTLAQATALYHDGEWAQCQADSLPAGIDTAVFDCAVNNGIRASIILLQRAIQACAGKTIEVDGLIGPVTVSTVTSICANTKWGLVDHLLQLRRDHYGNIVLQHPGDARFLRGWLNRVNDLEAFLSAS